MATVDATIYGAGIFGLSIAWECTRRGARVQVIDPNGPGAGASGGLVGALAPHTPDNWNHKKAFQLDSLLAAEEFWKGVDETSGISAGYGRTGRIQPLQDDRAVELARDRVSCAESLWRGRAIWSVVTTRELDGWVPPSATGLAVFDTLTARINPSLACKSLATALARTGVEIREKGAVAGPEIWATGTAGLEALNSDFGQTVGSGVKGQAALLAFSRPAAPQVFSDGLHFIPHENGTLAVGSTNEREFANADGTDELLDELVLRARSVMPVLGDAPVVARWAGVRPRARTRSPILGDWPGRPGHFVANGGFKIGLGMAPAVARTMADLVLDGIDKIPKGFRVTDNLKD